MSRHLRTRRSARLDRAARSACEPLESRRLLSTIVWTNRLVSDNFAIYGANATVARAIVDRAIDDWERVIVDFNYAAGGNTYSVDISAAAISGRGVTSNITRSDAVERKPTSADITMDDNGGGGGWYFDPVVGTATLPDDGEFTAINGPFEAQNATADNDFYRTIVHELGHAMGLLDSTGFFKIADYLTDGPADPVSAGSTLRLLNYNGGATDYTLTTAGGGHLFEGGGTYTGPIHPNDLMNDGRTVPTGVNIRQLISDDNALLLRDVYGYTITAPSSINTFWVNLNTTTNVLTVNGDINDSGSDVDLLDINQGAGGTTQFLIGGTSESIASVEFTTLNVNLGLGNDDVDINYLPSGKTVTIDMGDGNDRVDVTPLDDDVDTHVLSDVSIVGGAGTDTVTFHDTADGLGSDVWNISATVVQKGLRNISYAGYERLEINGSLGQPTAYNVNATAAGAALSIVAGAEADTFDVGGGDFDTNLGGTITLNGGGGADALAIDDSTDGFGSDSYEFVVGQIIKPLRTISYLNLESIAVQGSGEASTYRINASAVPLNVTCGGSADVVYVGDAVGSVGAGSADITAAVTVDGGAGDDQFFVGNGDLDESSATITLSGGGPLGGLNNSLTIDDTADTGDDAYVLVNGLLTKPGAGAFAGLNYSFINRTLIDMNAGANTFDFTDGFGFPTLQGNAGADTFNVISAPGGAQLPTIRGGAGLDNVLINQDEVGTAAVAFDRDEDLNQLSMFEGSTLTVVPNGDLGIDVASTGFLRGTLNLNDNFLVTGSPVSFIVDKLTRGYNAGAWNGVPAGGAAGVIRSATAAASALSDALGYVEVGVGAGQLNIGSYRGVALTPGDVVVSYTFYGDNNLDRAVNIGDFSNLATNFNVAATNWLRGNYNYDGFTNIGDFSLLAANFNQVVPASLPQEATAGGAVFSSRPIEEIEAGAAEEESNLLDPPTE